MGWLFPPLFGFLVLGMLWRTGRCSRQALELTGAVLLVALAGYAWQGRPTMQGAPVSNGSGSGMSQPSTR